MKNNIFTKIISSSLIILLFLLLFPIKTFATSNDKVIYLTFDDGPGGKVTEEILDILKKEDVKATFFIISSQVKGQEDIILRIKNEGHSIGLHSHTHDRKNLYSSNEAFLEEMLKCQEILYEVTGEKYYIIRFPFGCNNKSYKLDQSLVDLLHRNNFKIYDWTGDCGDGANCKLPIDIIIRNSTKLANSDGNIVMLMHCSAINKNTVSALPSIIKYYKDNGYSFKVINENTEEIYKFIKK
ncbi:polysaccharide deacetylase family protein [Clostridium isatidis]|uniref:Polysaccharide deacetylase n=1 Tax=Clostridium isatidis TaxID=182773 RepID=A0A343JCA7_9CLOT|nr:polysaccharide deacetylase family protein [Clostridium isatidis]ASW43165.1 polysaccharide deacetylase [Clostridium isatidis]NLZ34365.1 polysaccharide deacetylase [Clostridiales bacterium]